MDEKNLTNEESNFQNILKENENEVKEDYMRFLFASNTASHMVMRFKKKEANFNKPQKPYWGISDVVFINYLTFKIYTTLKTNPTLTIRINYEKFKAYLLKKDSDIYSPLYNTEDRFSI